MTGDRKRVESGDARATGARATLARFRALLARGATLQEASTKLQRPRSTLHRLAARHDLPRRRRSLHPAVTRQVDRDIAAEKSERWIVAMRGVGKGTVWRRKEARRKRLGQAKTVKPYRCPGPCGRLVCLKPCQICKTLEAMRQQTDDRTIGRQRSEVRSQRVRPPTSDL